MKKYVLVGTGWRGTFSYAEPLVKEYADCAELAAVCDINGKRARFVSEHLSEGKIPVYTDFDQMLKDHKPDVVIVTTKDCAHEQYIVKALEFGCDVISEKPMTTTDEMCARILEAEKRTGHKVTVTFNLRFMNFYVRLKELMMSGLVGPGQLAPGRRAREGQRLRHPPLLRSYPGGAGRALPHLSLQEVLRILHRH